MSATENFKFFIHSEFREGYVHVVFFKMTHLHRDPHHLHVPNIFSHNLLYFSVP